MASVQQAPIRAQIHQISVRRCAIVITHAHTHHLFVNCTLVWVDQRQELVNNIQKLTHFFRDNCLSNFNFQSLFKKTNLEFRHLL